MGLEVVLNPTTLLYCFVGVFLGTLIGAIPGLGAIMAVSILLPFTYHVEPVNAVIMLAGIYYGAEYGGSISSILLNMPGTLSSTVTCIEGYPMSQQGRAGVALFMTAMASLFGAIIGIAALIVFSEPFARLGLLFGPAEYFCLMLLGLFVASVINNGSPVKGIAMTLVGLLIGTFGVDVNSGHIRFSFGITELTDGINLIILATGLFGVCEIIKNISRNNRDYSECKKITFKSLLPTKTDVKKSVAPAVRGSLVGTFFGSLPGTGTAIAAFVAYSVEKKLNRIKNYFGNGAIEGVVSPEAANNAAAQTAFIPTMTLGIPGSATMAIIIGSLLLHDIYPGPKMIIEHPEIFWGLIMSFLVGNIVLIVLNIPLINIWTSILRIPFQYLYPVITAFIIIGIYSISKSSFDIMLLTVFGILGYILYLNKFEFAPLLLGYVIGPLMEENLRRSLIIFRGDLTKFLDRPATVIILSVLLIIICALIYSKYIKRNQAHNNT